MNLKGQALAVNGDVINNGTIEMSTGTLKVKGDLTNNATFDRGTGTVEFNGTAGTQNFTGITTFHHLTHSGNSTLSVTAGALDINGNFTNSAGIFDTNGNDMNVAGNWSNTGTFTHDDNKVTLDGTNQDIDGSTTFYELEKIVAAAATLTFQNGQEQIIANRLVLKGANNQLLSLLSDSDGVQWLLTLQAGGTQDMEYLVVKDSNGNNGIALATDINSQNLGNNDNWTFGGLDVTWDGSASRDWNDADNWDVAFIPRYADAIFIPSAPGNQPLLTSDVQVTDITINSGASLTLDGYDLAVIDTVSNEGTLYVEGQESITATTWDVDSGTVEYWGNGDGTVDTITIVNYGTPAYYNLIINDTNATKDIFQTVADLEVANDLTITTTTMDILTNSNDLTVGNDLMINGGDLDATNRTVDINGAFNLTSGSFTAPSNSKIFTVADDFIATGGTFTHSSGEVILDTTTAATINGDITFYDLRSTAAGKQINFTAGTNQTIEGRLTLMGTNASPITLRSSAAGQKWDISTPNRKQSVSYINVKDSDANDNTIFCLNCTDAGNNNELWQFEDFTIQSPQGVRTVGPTPTFIGDAPPDSDLVLKDHNNNIVASFTSYSNSRYRVELQSPLAPGLYDFYLYLDENVAGIAQDITVVASPTPAQEPVIDSPVENQIMYDYTPTLTGRGKPGDTVVIEASDLKGYMPLTQVGTGTVNGDGTYSVTVDTSLYGNTNYLTVTVDGVASDIRTVRFTDPRGYVFDSTTNKVIKDAVVTIYRAADGTMAEPGVDLIPTDVNPVITDDDGYYSFITADSDYYIRVEAFGYEYPSVKEDLPDGRDIVTGSRGEVFTVAGVVIDMDHPMDPNGGLIRVTKNANKGEVVVGEVVTYTVTMENISPSNEVQNVLLEDIIPPGFKYLSDRALLDGVPVNPTGQRPIYFDIGTMDIGELNTLKYQMVVGSGVDPGVYENVAAAVYDSGYQLSNRASASVKVVHDPLFDLGTVIGKVFHDYNENGVQDEPTYYVDIDQVIVEQPIAHVEIATEDGAVIRSDTNGLFHLQAIMPGRHIFRVDERTLPKGTIFTTDKAQIVDITNGLFSKVNFGVKMTLPQQGAGRSLDIQQDESTPTPRLNISLFNKELLIQNNELVDKANFRIFTNYSSFINKWRLDIIDKDTKKLINSFSGDKNNLYEEIVWDGHDQDGNAIREDRNYQYILVVEDRTDAFDETQAQDIFVRVLEDDEDIEEVDKEQRAKAYREWIKQEYAKNVLSKQSITVLGETLTINTKNINANQIQIIKSGKVVDAIPLSSRSELTARAFIDGEDVENVPVEVILPDGEYELVARGPSLVSRSRSLDDGSRVTSHESRATDYESRATSHEPRVMSHSKKVNIGGNHLFFVAMTDLKMGYTKDRGNIEPVQSNDKYNQGFWSEGKAAYYLKGKVLGKYLITSSYDSEREKKELFRNLDPDKYYPVYGDSSSVDYKATNTQGDLYLLVEWDKSHAVWGNYNVGFNETEFSKFNRSLYGGKLDYKSVSSTKYGEADTRVMVFRARAKQKTAHNEFISTGGSLYYLKHKDIVEGSDQVTIEVRDQITGEVLESKAMVSGVDYDMDGEDGRILFWQPIEMTVQSASIISNDLLDGNPIYMAVDYEYHVNDKFDEATMGARVSQAVTDSVIVGGTYVQESQEAANYTLRGTDMVVHLGDDVNIKAEYAESESDASGTFVSVDGGLTFEELATPDDAKDKAYGIYADARLFNRVGLETYYKYVGQRFSSNATSSEQGKKLFSIQTTIDLNAESRFTARHDIQALIDGGNADTRLQVGAAKTSTTNMQIIHEARRLRIVGEYFKHHVDGQEEAGQQKVAVRADYQLNDKVDVLLEREVHLDGKESQETTLGIEARPNDKTIVKAAYTVGTEGSSTSLGGKVNVTDRLALSAGHTIGEDAQGNGSNSTSVGGEFAATEKVILTAEHTLTENAQGNVSRGTTVGGEVNASENTSFSTDYTVEEDVEGNVSKGANVGTKLKISEKTQWESNVGFVQAGDDKKMASVNMGGIVEVDDNTNVESKISVTESSGGKVTALTFDANQKIDDKEERTAKVEIDQTPEGKKSSTIAFEEKRKLADDLTLEAQRMFTSSSGTTKQESKQSLVKDFDGRKIEGSLTKKTEESVDEISGSNIYGLSGDINDKWAASGSYERGAVKKHDGSELNRQTLSLGLGYVDQDIESGKEIKSSSKLELRRDQGQEDTTQYLIYNSTEAKLNHNTTLYSKLELSQTVTDNVEAAAYKEIVIGGAYRPIKVDRLNLLGRYTFLQGNSPDSQSDMSAGVEKEISHTISAEAVYDLTSRLQLNEKFAYRIAKEKAEDFDFNRTRTWLMIHRMNYRLDEKWTASAEYRMLTQEEAQDSKSGYLIEATRRISEYAQLGIGYNFTDFNDDLTNLSYSTQGPFIRITAALYDRTPEEFARAKEKWRQERIEEWSSRIVRAELNNKDSPLGASLNYMYRLAEAAYSLGQHKDAYELYRDISMTYEMMLAEARDYVVNQIEWEEKLSECQERAQGFYEQGDYVSAKQIWETILEELKKNPQERILDLEKCVIDDDKKRFYESKETNNEEGG